MTRARAKPLILIVDDAHDNREMYAVYLERRKFVVAEAGDGQTALEQSGALLPDLIVMDLHLPDIDGIEVIARLRSDPRTQKIPIIVVSGSARSAREPEASEPWDLFLSKPCLPDALAEEIVLLLASPKITAK